MQYGCVLIKAIIYTSPALVGKTTLPLDGEARTLR